jgi:hypothetical protein
MFDWKVDEEAEWDEPQRPSPSLPPTRRSNRRLWTATAVILILAAALFYTRLDRQVAQTHVDLTEEVTAAFLLLWQADRQGDADLFAQLRHDTSINAWRTEIDRIFDLGLLFDRATLGFTLTGTEPEIVDITFSPDWQTAVLTAQIAYDTAYVPDPIHLYYPLFYERIDGRWLLVPPSADYWGDTVRANDQSLTALYPQADEEIAGRLLTDLAATVTDACKQMAQMDQLRGCPADLVVNLRLQSRPGSLESLLLTVTQDRVRFQRQGHSLVRPVSFDLNLPTLTLLGVAGDEVAYTAVQAALSYWLLATVLTAQVDDDQLPIMRQVWLEHQLEQLGLSPGPAPVPPVSLTPPAQSPAAEVALLCAEPTTLSIDLLRLTPATTEISLLNAGADHDTVDSLFQGQVLGLRSRGMLNLLRFRPHLLLADGTPLTLPTMAGPPLILSWLAEPGKEAEVAAAWAEAHLWAIDLAPCLDQAEGNCQWQRLANWPIWSPSGRQQLFMAVDETAPIDHRQRLIRRGSLADPADLVDVGISAGADFLPFWVDETTYGYARLPADPAARPPFDFDLVLASVTDDEPQLLLTSDQLRAVLPSDPPSGFMMPQLVRPIDGRPDQFVIIVTFWPAELLPRMQVQRAVLYYDRADGTLDVLAVGAEMFVTPNGRFLFQWPRLTIGQQDVGQQELARANGRSWQLDWLDLTTGLEQQIAWPQQPGREMAVPAHDWSPLEDWFLLLADNTLLLVEAAVPQSGYTIVLADHVGDNYHCFDAVWMRTADSTTD